MTENSNALRVERIKAELKALKTDHDQLEQNLPPHGLKPGHLQRIEELEDLIREKEKDLAIIDPTLK
ncbi:MAG: hypothetical protein JRI95_16185 [Deltaproteobacteria bacterium]|nr:hypothetical protein [Deltaproteobacteria bacterium]MBW2086959.1 hypothetical protein [Deltaproteobacteria bacterium]